MGRFGQVGIAIGALGIVIALMGLFPGVTGVAPTVGIGVVQVIMMVVGYGLLIFGAIIYVKFTFYLSVESTLMQQIGIRLALTGLLFASLAGFADIFGFGSHLRRDDQEILLGVLQGFGILASFAMSSFGVLIYTVAGNPQLSDESQLNDLNDTTIVPDRDASPDDDLPDLDSDIPADDVVLPPPTVESPPTG